MWKDGTASLNLSGIVKGAWLVGPQMEKKCCRLIVGLSDIRDEEPYDSDSDLYMFESL
jgi:hypothetical protein